MAQSQETPSQNTPEKAKSNDNDQVTRMGSGSIPAPVSYTHLRAHETSLQL